MAFFDELGSKISGAAKSVTDKTNEVVETTKLNSKMSENKKLMAEQFAEIGKKLYEQYKAGETVADAFTDACVKIDELEKANEEIKIQISKAKGGKACPSCGNIVEKDAKFCAKCGTSMV